MLVTRTSEYLGGKKKNPFRFLSVKFGFVKFITSVPALWQFIRISITAFALILIEAVIIFYVIALSLQRSVYTKCYLVLSAVKLAEYE